MSRESLLRDTERNTTYTPRRNYSRNASYAQSASYRQSRAVKRETIPEGRDLFVVQLFASGILLLFVMFATIVDIPQTASIKEKLKSALSRHMTYEEVAAEIGSMRDKVAGIDNSAVEIFGGEVDDSGADNANKATDGAVPSGNPVNDEVSIDPDVLNRINEETEGANEYPKN